MLYKNIKAAILILSVVILLYSCDHGISPKPASQEVTGFSGKITFLGTWPDSIKRTHIVVFKDPLLSSGDFNLLNLKFISREIPFGTAVYYYSSEDSSVIPGTEAFAPGEYSYVAVVQQASDELVLVRSAWFVAGIYYTQGDRSNPGKLIIPEDSFVRNIDIVCDFNNPPPQPPGGN